MLKKKPAVRYVHVFLDVTFVFRKSEESSVW